MKNIILVVACLLIFCVLPAQPYKFLRIFDLSGQKIAKGYFSRATDTSIKLVNDSTTIEFSASKIGYIKTKRSGGHTILIASSAGGISMGLIAMAVNSSDGNDSWFQLSSGEAFSGGFIYGVVLGAVTGGIITGVNKRSTYQINGEMKKWMEVKAALEK